MFSTLIESRHPHMLRPQEAAMSLAVHAGLIVLAVLATTAGPKVVDSLKAEAITLAELKPEPKKPDPPPEPPKVLPRDAVVAPPLAKGFQVLTAPITIPDKIPDVDLSKAVTDEADFSGRGVEGGVGKGVVGGVVLPNHPADQPYFEFQVEKPVLPREGNPVPAYPNTLREASVTGHVTMQFVVDTAGRVELRTARALDSTHELFTIAVRNALPNMRFYPAEVGGRKVKQLVQQAFEFHVQ